MENEFKDEQWIIIKEAPDCLVSSYGRVKIKSRIIIDINGREKRYKEHIIYPIKKKTGYLEVNLPIKKNKRIYRLVHRLVLMNFNPVENMDNLEVNHIDENKINNRLDNLEWMTSKENCNYGNRNKKISNKSLKYRVYCEELDLYFNSQKEAAAFIGVSPSTMCTYISKKKIPRNNYHWIRIEENGNGNE